MSLAFPLFNCFLLCGREALIRRLVFCRKMVPHGLACGGNCFRAGEQFTTPNRAIRQVRRRRAVSPAAALHATTKENFALPQHRRRLEAHAGWLAFFGCLAHDCCLVAGFRRSVKLRVATAPVELSRYSRRECPLRGRLELGMWRRQNPVATRRRSQTGRLGSIFVGLSDSPMAFSTFAWNLARGFCRRDCPQHSSIHHLLQPIVRTLSKVPEVSYLNLSNSPIFEPVLGDR
ncbi:hypothetical protein B0T14DRAFT_283128 [Immersiella caudata]|uniref:Uncharacterized protein n=1 Tax=Immersiella caudata TaxID=314043 RepID=A0AA39WDZ7_9PEZI|nr:hypothetical protein B0T14DRAFT_283128 [Immersiella caudata]